MSPETFLDPDAQEEIDRALQNGQADRAFALLADYLTCNRLSLSDHVFRIYIERELFACLQGRGHKIDIL